MVHKTVKDVQGIIKKITLPVSKTFMAKKGKNAGNEFTVWSIGVMLDDGNYYNIKGNSEEAVLKYLYCEKFTRNYALGDEVKIYLEAEDQEEKYWRIASIVPLNPMDNVPVEDIVDEEEYIGENEVEEEPDKKYHVEAGVNFTKQETKKIETTATIAAPQTPAIEEQKAKDMKKVIDFKTLDADKYELGMAKNNAAILMSGLLQGKTLDQAKTFLKENGEYYDKLVLALFERGKKLREQVLGY
jgi:hypothetical protein